MPLDPKLLEILVCPVCHDPVGVNADETGLQCDACGRLYPVRDGIPIMLPEEARSAGDGGSPGE